MAEKQKPMTFAQAVKQLRKMSKDKYCSIEYSQSFHTSGNVVAECEVYHETWGWLKAPTWEEVLVKLSWAMKPITMKPDSRQAPK